MIVKSLSLEGFRNYQRESVSFGDGVNVILGDNAQGKTNLLEAVYYLTCGRSFRSRSDRDVVNLKSEFASIQADVLAGGRGQRIEVAFGNGRKKRITAGGVLLKSASELYGRLTAVLFCPDDLFIIKEGAAARRKLLDGCISQLRPRYAAILASFNRAYEQKTRILRDFREKPSLLEALDEYNHTLCRMSAELIRYRAYFAGKLGEEAAAVHREFSGGAEELTVRYKTVSNVENPFLPAAELLILLLEHQKAHRTAEIESGLCLSGAHKDDLEIDIDGRAAKSFASQGQTRTAALSLKLAERELLFRDRGEYPVLLLDDVLSELDQGRQSFVLNRISGGQVFITCCEDARIAERTGGKVLTVENGRIIP